MNYTKEKPDKEIENTDEEEDLRRFLKGGFGAK